jgi:phage tail protein X
MPLQYRTKAGDVLDAIVFSHYSSHEPVLAVLESNPVLAKLPVMLPAGILIILPDIQLPSKPAKIELWSV